MRKISKKFMVFFVMSLGLSFQTSLLASQVKLKSDTETTTEENSKSDEDAASLAETESSLESTVNPFSKELQIQDELKPAATEIEEEKDTNNEKVTFDTPNTATEITGKGATEDEEKKDDTKKEEEKEEDTKKEDTKKELSETEKREQEANKRWFRSVVLNTPGKVSKDDNKITAGTDKFIGQPGEYTIEPAPKKEETKTSTSKDTKTTTKDTKATTTTDSNKDSSKKADESKSKSSESTVATPGYKASSKGGNGTTKINALNGTWQVVNTPIRPDKYATSLQNRKVCQNSDTKKYGGACLGFSDCHAWGLFKGNTSYTAKDGAGYAGASNFKMYSNENKQSVLKVIYEEIKAGRPCILHVNGNKQGTSRHFVTVVGFKDGVTGDNITEDDLLIIDSWDAKLERMDQSGSRFMTTGKACGKTDYTGWRVDIMR